MNRRSFAIAASAATLLGASPPPSATPSPLAESDYSLVTATGTLSGTLALPAGVAKPPVVLIIAGSGPTDRNGNAAGLSTDAYRLLAADLGRRGFATVRYDKRGIAASRSAALVEANVRFEAFVADAAAWVAQLRADARFGAIGIAGHSEGSLIGMLAAAKTSPDAFVSLEGPGRPAAEVVRGQIEPRLAGSPKLLAANDRILRALVRGQRADDVPKELLVLYRPSVQPYLISLFAYDPRVAIAAVRGRVAIVQGTYDVQVPVADGRALAAANPRATLRIVERMSHMLKDAAIDTLASQAATVYGDPSLPIDPAVPDTIAATLASA